LSKNSADTIEVNFNTNPNRYPDWHWQLLSLPEKNRQKIISRIMNNLKEAKPDCYEFIKKFSCQVVGIQPRVEYVLGDESNGGDMNVTYVHTFSMPTILFWCPEGGFGFFVNPNLMYDDSVINHTANNPKKLIKGFTG
jgi:hypothetical protein